MTMRNSLFSVLIMAIGTVSAADYYLKPDATDWSKAASYTIGGAGGSEAEVPPGKTDIVHLPAKATFAITAGTESFGTFAALGRIVPDTGSRIEVTVTEGSYDVATPISANGENRADCAKGVLVKKGTGTLVLKHCGRVMSGSDCCDYYTGFEVEAGVLKFPQDGTVANNYFGDVVVGSAGTLFTVKSASNTFLHSLNGSGVVTNDYGSNRMLKFEKEAAPFVESRFSGSIDGSIRVYSEGGITLTGTHSTMKGDLTIEHNYGKMYATHDGRVSLMSFGMKGHPSSAGIGDNVRFSDAGAGYEYLGTGETTDKSFVFYTCSYYAFLDAGATGGISFTGSWENLDDGVSDSRRRGVKGILLTGSNTVPCTVEGEFKPIMTLGTNYSFYITKQGSGTWRFKDHSKRNMTGGFSIEEGTLQFDSLAEAGVMCSLGTATQLTKPMFGVFKDDSFVDYAFLLGKTDGSSAPVVFDYTGSGYSCATTRPARVVGDVTIRSSATGTGYLALAGVGSVSGGAKTLTLDGTNTCRNTLGDITDDAANALSVVKDGTGTWNLSGAQDFHGTLNVRKGTLNVIGDDYRYFRFVFKELMGGSSSYRIEMRKIAIYDADGNRINAGITASGPRTGSPTSGTTYTYTDRVRDLEAGLADYGDGRYTWTDGADIGNLFTEVLDANPWKTTGYDSAWKTQYPSASDPTTWITVVFRLPAGANPAVRYDLCCYWSGNYSSWPRIWTVEGSSDGIRWEELDSRDYAQDEHYATLITKSNCWYSDPSESFVAGGAVRKDKGFAFKKLRTGKGLPLGNAASISVRAGATLAAIGEMAAIDSLFVDGYDAGTLKNVALAAEGTLSVVNLPKNGVLPLVLENVSGLENLSAWSVLVGTTPKPGYRLRVTDGRIVVVRPGFMMIFR